MTQAPERLSRPSDSVEHEFPRDFERIACHGVSELKGSGNYDAKTLKLPATALKDCCIQDLGCTAAFAHEFVYVAPRVYTCTVVGDSRRCLIT